MSLVKVLGAFLLIMVATISNSSALGPYFSHGSGGSSELRRLWQEVSTAENKKLPKTAIEKLDKIITLARDEGEKGHFVKAWSKKVLNQAHILGKKPQDKVKILKDNIDAAGDDVKPMLNTILAIWYWNYYNSNRYKFQNRSQTAGLNDDDFTTWDSPKLYQKVAELFDTVLVDSEWFKTQKLSEYKGLINKGGLSDEYCETLFEFFTREALEFYKNGMSTLPKPQDAYEIDSNTDAFSNISSFIKYNPSTSDKKSHALKSIRLYQELLRFLRVEQRFNALIDTDISRMKFVLQHGVGGNKQERFLKQMKTLSKKFKSYDASTMAIYEIAQVEFNKKEFLSAMQLCFEAMKRFPSSDGAKLCENLKARILQKSFSAQLESTINKHNSQLSLQYKNVKKLYFRVVEDEWDRGLDEEWADLGDYLSDEEVRQLLDRAPVMEWTVDLKETKDYKQASQMVNIPDLPYGYYRVFISENPDFRDRNQNQVSYNAFWVTDTTILMRRLEEDVQGMVVDSNNGNPLEDVRIRTYRRDRNGRYKPYKSVTTDDEGLFELERENSRRRNPNMIFYVQSRTGDVLYRDGMSFGGKHRKHTSSRTTLYTDRAIYRPGQLIQFKGICQFMDPNNFDYRVMDTQKVQVVLRDANYQEIFKKTYTTNEFGSFSGQYTAPRDVLTGRMTLTASNPSGSVSFRVEEYKRPKFEVKLKKPKEQQQLNQMVKVKGLAESYSGVSVADAKVKYRVVRQVELPWWWRWHNPWGSGSQEIAHGEAKTKENGEFEIEYMAKPDLKVNPKAQPVFNYRVEVDVVDTTGETRSDEISVKIGYTAIDARISLGNWLIQEKPIDFKISTKTHDGIPVFNKGKVTIYGLKQPNKPVRKPASFSYWRYYCPYLESASDSESSRDESDYKNWELGKKVKEFSYKASNGQSSNKLNLKKGAYKAILVTKDEFGNEVTSELPFLCFSQQDKDFGINLPSYFKVKSHSVEVGDYMEAYWGTGYENAKAYVSYIRDGEILKSYWTEDTKRENLMFKVDESLKGGFTLQVVFVHENQSYIYTNKIQVPWTDKRMKISFETFRSKLRPNEKETWTIKLEGQDAERIYAELGATLYDASLDSFVKHSWGDFQGIFFNDRTWSNYRSNIALKQLLSWISNYHVSSNHVDRSYPSLPWDIKSQFNYLFPSPRRRLYRKSMAFSRGGMMTDSMGAAPEVMAMSMDMEEGVAGFAMEKKESNVMASAVMAQSAPAPGGAAPKKEKKKKFKARANLNETAFFFPQLVSDAAGVVKLVFQMPEALTRWKFLAIGHDKNLISGLLNAEVVTQKELMVQPNPPRFLRQGDELEFTAKVSNMSDVLQSGQVELNIFNALDDSAVDGEFGVKKRSFKFHIDAKRSKTFSWRIKVPDVFYPIRYRVMADAGKFTDGEEGLLPILSRYVLVRESMPLWISGKGSKNFKFDKLIKAFDSDTLVHEKLVLQMTSNPAWYAVQALPYLAKHPLECTDQVFNRLYANKLGEMIANHNPRIERIFKQWQGTDALKSNLQKNEDLKGVLLQETPWVVEAKNEEQAKNNVANFFDRTRMENELSDAFKELKKRQMSSGSWPWFPGGRKSDHITLSVVTGFGRLRNLGIKVDTSLAIKAIRSLDLWMKERYEHIKRHNPHYLKHSWIDNASALYLYGRSFFLKERKISRDCREAIDFWLDQAAKHWTKLNNRMGEAHVALGLNRFEEYQVPKDIIKSLRERARHDEEMGMFWSDEEISWWWYRAPIETQALMIELFDEVASSEEEVAKLKVWLLKQKQTQDWKTNRATADAVYALLIRGDELLNSTKLVQTKLGDYLVQPKKVEAGTGYYEQRFSGGRVKEKYGDVTITKLDKGIAWGGLHWQYFEDISKVTSHKTPLSLEKRLFVRRNTKSGPVIKPFEQEKLSQGDTMVVRVVLRVDRDMEYVHMKDMRGCGTEPVNVLSKYKYQDGLAYYESTKDTATHFYFDYLPKGTYVFEYDLKIFHKGSYQAGMAEIECLYAPEFNSHSESKLITVE
jgi:uncharacterized protein YfaS (alpha-2-macroglobulin family)